MKFPARFVNRRLLHSYFFKPFVREGAQDQGRLGRLFYREAQAMREEARTATGASALEPLELSVAQVSELLRIWADVSPVELDLTDLVSADSGGIEALRRIRDAGTSLVGAPGYIRLRVDSVETSPPPTPADPHPPKRRGSA